MTLEQYSTWLAVARRHARVALEAEDLLHNALLAAAHADRLDLEDESNRRWLTGVIRNQAAFDARSAVRRREREVRSVDDAPMATSAWRLSRSADPARPWSALGLKAVPRSARRVLVLALHGLGRDEVRATLRISDAALRQRLVTLRRALHRLPDLEDDARAASDARRDERSARPVGLIRRALSACDHLASGLGTHDPDGHLIVLQSSVG